MKSNLQIIVPKNSGLLHDAAVNLPTHFPPNLLLQQPLIVVNGESGPDWLTFLSDCLSALAWPCTVVFTMVYFRPQIRDLLKRIKKGNAFGSEWEFSEAAIEAIEMAPVLADREDRQVETPLLEAYNLAGKYPQASITLAWNILHKAALNALGYYPSSESSDDYPVRLPRTIVVQRLLQERGILNEAQTNLFNEARNLRNIVVHDPRRVVSSEQAKDYVLLSDSLLEALSPHLHEASDDDDWD